MCVRRVSSTYAQPASSSCCFSMQLTKTTASTAKLGVHVERCLTHIASSRCTHKNELSIRHCISHLGLFAFACSGYGKDCHSNLPPAVCSGKRSSHRHLRSPGHRPSPTSAAGIRSGLRNPTAKCLQAGVTSPCYFSKPVVWPSTPPVTVACPMETSTSSQRLILSRPDNLH